MFEPINLKKELVKVRKRELKQTNILNWVTSIFSDLDDKRNLTFKNLQTSETEKVNHFNFKNIDVNEVFHINQIEKICVDYRLRFLDTKYFKGDYPEEVISKIHKIEQKHNITLVGFKIAAPSVLFKLKKADDPILFAPMGNGYFYLIHKWGNDLHPLRKLKFWGIKRVRNFFITICLLSLTFTLLTHTFFFREHSNFIYAVVLFLFYLKGGIGFGLYLGIASGKNFSQYCWQSKYDKIC